MVDGSTIGAGAAEGLRGADRLIADVEKPRPKVKPARSAGWSPTPEIPLRSRGPRGPAHDLGRQVGDRKPRSTDSLRKGVEIGTPSGARPSRRER